MMDNQEAKRDNGKVRLSLLDPEILKAMARVREYGVIKYGDEDNWKKVDTRRYMDAAFRHLLAAMKNPNAADQESELPALWHCACNLMFIISRMGGDFPNGILPEDIRNRWEAMATQKQKRKAEPKDAPKKTKVYQLMQRGIRIYGASHEHGEVRKLRIDKGNMRVGDVFICEYGAFRITDETVAERVEKLDG